MSDIQKRIGNLSSKQKRELLARMLRERPVGTPSPPSSHEAPCVSSDKACLDSFDSSLKIERRPLLSLFARGDIDEIDAAAVGYLPNALLDYTGLTREEIINDWCGNQPVLFCVLETFLGRVALILLPRFSSELYVNVMDVAARVVDALHMAKRLGARTASLMGLLPAATNCGRSITAAVADPEDVPPISTGHATTAAAVVLGIGAALRQAGRELAGKQVGFIGLDAVGLASLRLMLRRLPHPAEIILCDVYKKRGLLGGIRNRLTEELGFRGSVRVTESGTELPSELYEATLIVGAINTPDTLDVTRLKTGTIVVNDSAPDCFVTQPGVGRLHQRKDILFIEGDLLRSPHPFGMLVYLPQLADRFRLAVEAEALSRRRLFQSHLPSCMLSSLLSSRFKDLKATVGFIDDNTSLQNYDMLNELGFQAAELHSAGSVLPKGLF
jgi:predicted amino acid dehydrogenase